MKMLLIAFLSVASVTVFAASPELPDLSKDELEKVSNEFAMNFSHTAVAAPETTGVWGIEVGVLAGTSKSPKLEDLIDRTGEDGSDFKNIYHAGVMARAHFPLDLFLELSVLPEREISDVTVAARSLGLGWNAGAFFGLPLDLAIGVNASSSEISFKQIINNASTGNTDVDSKINLDSTTRVLWLGVSKTFLFFTPYAKVGTAKSESDVKVDSTTGTIFTFSSSQKETVSSDGSFVALGANFDIFFVRLGLEATQTADVKRISAKLSFAF